MITTGEEQRVNEDSSLTLIPHYANDGIDKQALVYVEIKENRLNKSASIELHVDDIFDLCWKLSKLPTILEEA